MRGIDAIVKKSFYLFLSIVVSQGCSTPEDNAYKSPPLNNNPAYIPQSDTTTRAPAKAGPHTFTIEIKKMKFDPEVTTVHQGDTVIWINNDMVTHCVSEEKTKAWTSLALPAGSSWKKVVSQSSDYYCAIHQVMKGKILVQ